MWFVWWTLHVFAQVVGFLVSPKNGSGSTKDTTYPSWTPQMRIYFLDPSGGLGVGPLRPSWFPDLLSLLVRDWSTSPALLVSPGFASRGSLLFLSALQSSSASSAPNSTGKYCAPVMAAPASLGQRPTGFKTVPPVGGLALFSQTRQATHP